MIPKLTSLLLLILCSFGAIAQKIAPTTEEEYNYCVRGYKTMLAEGLDMKKGYRFENIFEKGEGGYSFNLKLFMREDKKEVAAILVIAKSPWGNTYYHCIPYDNEMLLNKYWSDLGAWDKPMLLSFTKLITAYFGALLPNVNEIQKQIKNKK